MRRMAERIIYSLDTNGYLKTPLEELLPPIPADVNGDAAQFRAEQLAIAEQALAVVQRLDPPGVGARSLKECLLLQLTPGMPLLRRAADADRRSPGRPGKQPPAADLEEDRLVDREDSRSLAGAAQAQAEAGRRLRRDDRAERDARRVRRAERSGQVRSAAGRHAAAVALHQPLLPQAAEGRKHQRRDPRVHQAEGELGPMADRVDRAAPQHAHPRVAGDRRPPDEVSRRRARTTSSRSRCSRSPTRWACT